MKPIGYYLQHDCLAAAERAAAIAWALPRNRRVVFFTARPEMLSDLPHNARVEHLPLQHEPAQALAPANDGGGPSNLSYAPFGRPGMREALATLASWFYRADPSLFVADMSPDLAQLARAASVPVVSVLRHGADSAADLSAYESSVGILAPYHQALEQTERPRWLRARACYLPGLHSVQPAETDRAAARAALDLDQRRETVVIFTDGSAAQLHAICLAALNRPETLWRVLGAVPQDPGEPIPGNLHLLPGTEDPALHMAAADVVVAPPEHGLAQQILALGRPWIVLPGSRRHRQQRHLARALARAGAACYMPAWPSTPFGWDRAIEQVRHIAADAQQALVQGPGARDAALWLDRLATALWQQAPLQEAAE